MNIANYYLKFINNPLIQLPKLDTNSNHVFHLFVIKTNYRDSLVRFLSKHNISTSIHYPVPPHLSGAFLELGFKEGSFLITENQAKSVLSLPLYDYMKISEAKYVVKIINNYKD
jgi:dTDP-4-amino-4,6-dideoxygalactose transaminase